MRYENVSLHNVAAVTEHDDGVRLDRLPPAVRASVNENAREMYTWPAGVELRAVSDEKSVTVTLSCPEGECEATPYHGSFMSSPENSVTLGPEPTTVSLTVPEHIETFIPDVHASMAFDPRVRRLALYGQPVVLHDITGDARPPQASELPDRRYLVYGTSITQGLVASRHCLTYAGRTARQLDADLVNLGCSGSAYCESAMADYIAHEPDWDIATLSISVNMLADGFAVAEFRKRANYFLETIAGECPEKPVIAITLFPVYPDVRTDIDRPKGWEATPEEYREALRDVVAQLDHENVHLLEGPELLSDPTGLSPDLVHPTDNGMIQIGDRLSGAIETILTESDSRPR